MKYCNKITLVCVAVCVIIAGLAIANYSYAYSEIDFISDGLIDVIDVNTNVHFDTYVSKNYKSHKVFVNINYVMKSVFSYIVIKYKFINKGDLYKVEIIYKKNNYAFLYLITDVTENNYFYEIRSYKKTKEIIYDK